MRRLYSMKGTVYSGGEVNVYTHDLDMIRLGKISDYIHWNKIDDVQD